MLGCAGIFRCSLHGLVHITYMYIHCYILVVGEKPFTCDICSKSFAHKSDMNRHKITHSGNQYSCVCVCVYMYKPHELLLVHVGYVIDASVCIV